MARSPFFFSSASFSFSLFSIRKTCAPAVGALIG
jgi:hypothetical protein